MSDRLDMVVIENGAAVIHHQRWGAGALFDTLLGGPERAVDLARTFASTEQLDDLMAACVIDLDHQRLVVAGRANVISASGPRVVQPDELLGELAPSWPGWALAYEPDYIIEPVALYVRGLGLPLASMNEPHVVADALGKPRFTAARYHAEGKPAGGALPSGRASTALIASLGDLSIRAENELDSAGLRTLADVAGLDEQALALRGLSQKTIRELRELLEREGS
jgi:hypothetical protein